MLGCSREEWEDCVRRWKQGAEVSAVDLCKLIGFDAGESVCITEDQVGERISKKGQRIAA